MLKIWFIVYFESLFGGPVKFILPDRIFSIKTNTSVLYDFCLICFCCVLFLIRDEYGIGLNVESPCRSSL